ncbi:MAG: VWA domain-containing protein [Gemmataceae bacterium]|nr:VWA domain-containing protein [Gemmataceae bacterium]
MRGRSHTRRADLHRAIGASVALHVAVVGVLVLLLRAPSAELARAGIDTRAPDVCISTLDQPNDPRGGELAPAPVSPPAPEWVPPRAATNSEPQPAPPSEPPAPAGPSGPFVSTRPPASALEARAVELFRQSRARASSPAPSDASVKPAAGTAVPGARALHGAFKPDQTVVYVLDTSGSMGAQGKLDAARASLLTSLAQQPAAVRFQVVVYDGTVQPLLAGGTPAPFATPENVRAAATKLAALEARGRCNHLAAVRTALAFRPDVLVLLTDAADLTANALRGAFVGEARRVPVFVALVTDGGVQQPLELK